MNMAPAQVLLVFMSVALWSSFFHSMSLAPVYFYIKTFDCLGQCFLRCFEGPKRSLKFLQRSSLKI